MRFIDLKLFLLLFACVAGAVLCESPVRFRALIETRDPWDIAIAGQGYFSVTDPEISDTFYTRTGKLNVNIHGHLCIFADGKEWLTEPCITIPQDWNGIIINKEGHVHSNQSGSLANIGQFQLAKFQVQPVFENDFAVNAVVVEKHGLPSITNPGTAGTGQILQGWLEQPAESATYRYAKPILIGSIIAIVLKVLLDSIAAQQKVQRLWQEKQPPGELQ